MLNIEKRAGTVFTMIPFLHNLRISPISKITFH